VLARLLERKEQPHLKSEGFGNLPKVGSLRPAFDHCDTGTASTSTASESAAPVSAVTGDRGSSSTTPARKALS
jgi:hypothetical protein